MLSKSNKYGKYRTDLNNQIEDKIIKNETTTIMEKQRDTYLMNEHMKKIRQDEESIKKENDFIRKKIFDENIKMNEDKRLTEKVYLYNERWRKREK